MASILVRPTVMSVYEVNGQRVPMPERMARVTPDMKKALYAIRAELEAAGGKLALSDLFRTYDMQFQAHLDYASGKKKAFSPPPGSSMHESGRAFDVDLASIKVPLATFWQIARRAGVVPIIAEPDPGKSECWHFECRGSHQRVYDHYKAGKGSNFERPAEAMAASAIVSVGLQHDKFKGKEGAAFLQSGLIRLGHDIGNIDGDIGPKTLSKLETLGIRSGSLAEQTAGLDALLQQQFPEEYFDRAAEPMNPFA
jgi:hypothetical protein